MSKPPTEQIRVVVVGAGFGGIATVKALGGAPVAVTLVDSNNFRNRISVLVNWVWNYLTYDRGARLILGPERQRQREPDRRR